MATNPMQKKARNSFIMGMFVMLLISAVIIGGLVFLLLNEKKKEEAVEYVQIAVLKQEVKSGDLITSDMLTKKTIDKNTVPSNAIASAQTFDAYTLKDSSGNQIKTDSDGKLYIDDSSKTQVNMEKKEGSILLYKQEGSSKTYITVTQTPMVAKITMKANTVITTENVAKSDEVITNDLREQEYNMIILPMDIQTGDFIDIRLLLPSGHDFIVISKKRVVVPDIAGIPASDTVVMQLTEQETTTLSSAIVEAYMMTGAKLYATKYVEAGMQEKAIFTYRPSDVVANSILSNPNIETEARNALVARYEAYTSNRQYINSNLSSYEDGQSTYEKNLQEQITRTKETRKKYLDSLSAAQ